MIREWYADNYQERRLEVLLRAEDRCEQRGNDQRCLNRLGIFKISHSYQPYFEQLYMHHPDNDPGNPEARMIAVCASCHMRLHRQAESHGKASPKKQGYQVVSITHLLSSLARVGFRASYNEECRVSWRFEQCAFEHAPACGMWYLLACIVATCIACKHPRAGSAGPMGEHVRLA